MNAEQTRVNYKNVPWKKWGPYLSERQWGTVREDYSPDGEAWDYLPHDHARSRAYRWGEDGLDASTVTPGSTAPDASRTTPAMALCAAAGEATR